MSVFPFRFGFMLCILLIAGCASQRHYDANRSQSLSESDFSVGDTVRITGNAGQEQEFTITQVSESGIQGQDVSFTYEDLQDLEVEVSHNRSQEDIAADVAMAPFEMAFQLLLVLAIWGILSLF